MLRIEQRCFVDMVSGAPCFEFHQVQHILGAQPCFFLQLAQCSILHGLTALDLAAGQHPATSGLAHHEDMAVVLANDGCTYFHLFIQSRLSHKCNKNAIFGP
ncbi:hypothetical protein D3C81_2047480 [compost metagenome]